MAWLTFGRRRSAAVERRVNRLSAVLHGCLQWHELLAYTTSPAEFEPPPRARVRPQEVVDDATHSRVADGAKQKYDFLFHALACCLAESLEARGPTPSTVWIAPDYIGRTIADDGTYFTAYAYAKLFRASLSTRELRWNKKWKDKIQDFVYHGSSSNRISPADRRRLKKAKTTGEVWVHDVFCPGPFSGPDTRAPARLLAQSLMRRARKFTEGFNALSEQQQRVLKDAVMRPTPYAESTEDRHVLRQVHGALRGSISAIDKLWERDTDCDFSRYCLEFDEYCRHRDPCTSSDGHVFTDKLAVLESAVNGIRPDDAAWKHVARSWLCRGFRMGYSHWEGAIARSAKTKIDLAREAQDIVDYINDPDHKMWFRPWERNPSPETCQLYRDTLRMATAGYPVDAIEDRVDWGGGKRAALGFLFGVAAARKPDMENAARINEGRWTKDDRGKKKVMVTVKNVARSRKLTDCWVAGPVSGLAHRTADENVMAEGDGK